MGRILVRSWQPHCSSPGVAAAQSRARRSLSGYIQARETYREDAGLTGTINRAR